MTSLRTDTSVAGLYVFFNTTVSVKENDKEDTEFFLYPNPAKGYYTLIWEQTINRESAIHITSIIGETVYYESTKAKT